MTRHLLAALLTAALLTGCTNPAPSADVSPTGASEERAWDPGGGAAQTGGAVQVSLQTWPDAYGLVAMGEGALVLSGKEKTTLTLLPGHALTPAAEAELGQQVAREELIVTDTAVQYFHRESCRLVVLDSTLTEIFQIDLPEGTASALLDGDCIYYTNGSDIRVWDRQTGRHRLIRQSEPGAMTLSGLVLEGQYLLCRQDGKIQVIAARDGSLLWEGEGLALETDGNSYYARIPQGAVEQLVFGSADAIPQSLTPSRVYARGIFLPRQQAAVTAEFSGTLALDAYDLTTGRRTSSLTLSAAGAPLTMAGTDTGAVYLLMDTGDSAAVYCWDPAGTQVEDPALYTGHYYTAQSPDTAGLRSCQTQADALGERYGISIVLAPQEEGGEYLVPVLEAELKTLEQRLGAFPAGLLETAFGNFSEVAICLVRKMTENADCPVDLSQGRVDMTLPVGETSGEALYHQLYHVLETQILNASIALDQWEKLNPVDFTYDYGAADTIRDAGPYLDADIRCFVDLQAMGFPREDRAQIFAAAMTAGNEALFAASPLQYKLRQLCLGIREAFDLERYPETLPWERYLTRPLEKTA